MFRIGHRIARSIHRKFSDEQSVDVSESDGVRYLHLGSDTVQSAMRINNPTSLELRYTRGVMMFLLFMPEAKSMLGIGLGGASIARYIHHHLPALHQRVVEINPQVINVARSHFALPDDDERLQVIEGDGAEYIRNHPDTADVLFLDAYGSDGLPQELSSQGFFDDCAAALHHDGVLISNLWGSDKRFDIYLQRIEQSFGGRVLVMPTGKPGNILVFGFRRGPNDLRWSTLRERARALESRHRIEFLEFVEALRDRNPSTSNRLLLDAMERETT
ncbi:spermidine synthase [Methylophilaceae bacterium]|nr:spermidine synthase [Methylophilaceae bacterium]